MVIEDAIIPQIVKITKDLQLDLVRLEIKSGKDSTKLTAGQMGCLIFLLNSPKPVTTEEILTRLGKTDKNHVWVLVSRLRSKLEKIGFSNAIPRWGRYKTKTKYKLVLSRVKRKGNE